MAMRESDIRDDRWNGTNRRRETFLGPDVEGDEADWHGQGPRDDFSDAAGPDQSKSFESQSSLSGGGRDDER